MNRYKHCSNSVKFLCEYFFLSFYCFSFICNIFLFYTKFPWKWKQWLLLYQRFLSFRRAIIWITQQLKFNAFDVARANWKYPISRRCLNSFVLFIRGHSESTYALKGEMVPYENLQREGGILQRAYVRSCNFHKVNICEAPQINKTALRTLYKQDYTLNYFYTYML